MTPLEEAELRQLVWIENQMRKCDAKTKFYSEGAAQLRRGPHSKRTPPKLWTYHCRWCGCFHLTHRKPMQGEDKRRAA